MKKLTLVFAFCLLHLVGYSQTAIHIFNAATRFSLTKPDRSTLDIKRGYTIIESSSNSLDFMVSGLAASSPTTLGLEAGKAYYFIIMNNINDSNGYRINRNVREVTEREFHLTLLINSIREVPRVVKY